MNWILQIEHRATEPETQFVARAALAILLTTWLLAGFSAMTFAKVLSLWRPNIKPRYWMWFVITQVLCFAGFAEIPIYGSATPIAIIFFGGGLFTIIAQRQIVKDSRQTNPENQSSETSDDDTLQGFSFRKAS